MKNLISIIIVVLSVISCSEDDDVFGSGKLVTENRSVASFTKINSSGVFELTVTQGDVQSVEVRADDNIISDVRTEVVGDELMLYLDGDEYRNLNLSARIVVRDLDEISNEGTGNVVASNINSNGTFSVFNAGSADINITGIVRRLNLDNEGSGSFQGFALEVEDVVVKNHGSGAIEVSCSESLDATISGSGNVFYKGSPTLNVSYSGSGTVVKVD